MVIDHNLRRAWLLTQAGKTVHQSESPSFTRNSHPAGSAETTDSRADCTLENVLKKSNHELSVSHGVFDCSIASDNVIIPVSRQHTFHLGKMVVAVIVVAFLVDSLLVKLSPITDSHESSQIFT